MKQAPIIIERTIQAPAGEVWAAISDRDKMKEWYFNLREFKPEVGFEFEFEGGPDDRIYVHLCQVTEAVPGEKLAYSWRYQGYEGISFVTFELFAEGKAHTKIRLTHTGLDTFPKSNPDLAKQNFVAGWNDIIGNLLPNFLEKAPVTEIS
ncbi:SRPBCC family protein [Rufibacter roseus]|uniref:SRPBCC domain-containing protein n=1 Tax=Rufibacter roseus TaxID=1567108 RepID=A0ABW2DMK2_9BACT|nr:SRPBCC domain-containing protein [Rufibacter roseus]